MFHEKLVLRAFFSEESPSFIESKSFLRACRGWKKALPLRIAVHNKQGEYRSRRNVHVSVTRIVTRFANNAIKVV